jgi:Putative beta-barrel porin-2, OmpL-like. bbp2/Carboxypeptidase regulatory-like domain
MALNLVSAQAQSPLGTLHGVTVNADGAPIASTPVVIHRVDDNTDRTIISGFDGAFSVANLKPGRYEVRASKGELRSLSSTVDLAAQQDLKVDLALAPNTPGDISPAVAKKLEAMAAMEERMAARIEQLEAQLKTKTVAEQPTTPALRGDLVASLAKDPNQIPILPATLAKPDTSKAVASAAGSSASGQDAKAQSAPPPPAAPAVDLQTPFAYGDFTWLNGSPRNKDVVFDSPFFTPEVRFDTHYMEDFNQPKDHTIVGATESFRSGEVQIEQASVGGDFHWQNVRGRILFMDGLFATTTPRNDASSATGTAPGNTGGVGQWDLQGAYKYVSEAYGGYHFNVNHGLNVDAGIFVSYIGLFSYYNFDNWTYQPSYVSSNTPWFFNGVRVQWFPTNKLKIEPWFVNGWQSYAKFNGHPGLGGQLLWQPKEWFKLVANQYGFGQDNLGLPHTERIHTDDSIEVRYYNHPESTGITKMAFSLTGDAGGQYGGGLCATCGSASGSSNQKEAFIGWMLYDRTWWHHDTLGLTLGGGYMNNPGRYLTLLPPIDGATAATGTPYFTELPGQPAHMWDSTVTLQYMPKQYITWWAEVGYRHSDVPYFAGRGGVTPPGGNNGLAQYYTCANGATAGTATLAAAQTACGGANNVWFPDLRRSESKVSVGVMVKF